MESRTLWAIRSEYSAVSCSSMLSIIDRYIAKKYLLFFTAGLLVFVTIFLAVDFIGSFARYQVSTGVLFRYYAYFLPQVIHQMFPVASLLATIFTLSHLNSSNELVALFSMGSSLARVSAPILVIVALTSVVFFWAGDRLLPSFAQKKSYVEYVEIKKKPGLYSTVKTNKIWYRSENVLFNIQTLNSKEATAQGLTLYYFDSTWRLIQMIKATSVKMKNEVWELSDGIITIFAEESKFPLTKSFEAKTVIMNEDVADLQSSAPSSDVQSVGQLRRFITKNKEAGLDTLGYEVDYHSKFGFAFAAFVMSLIGIPFSVSGQRSGGGFKNAGVCVGLAFGYWALFSSSPTLGRHGMFPPVVAAWGPNLLTVGFAVYLLIRLKK